jgi:hypothetical protein
MTPRALLGFDTTDTQRCRTTLPYTPTHTLVPLFHLNVRLRDVHSHAVHPHAPCLCPLGAAY